MNRRPKVVHHRQPYGVLVDGLSGSVAVAERERQREVGRRARRAAGGAGVGAAAGRPAGAAGLDKTQSYETPPLLSQVKPAVAEARLTERYRRLDWLRKLSTKKRVRQCKTPIGSGRVGLVGHDDGTGAHFTGVESCANVWCCPVCAPKIRAGRTTDVLEAFERHQAAGGGFVFVTVTLPHEHGDRLGELLGLLSDAWTYVTRQRGFKAWRERAGLVGNIAALEVTRGDNGWHPHRHLMMFTERPLSPDMVHAWESELHALYNRYLRKQGWKASKAHIGVRMDYVGKPSEAVARYITKMQAGFELTRADLKKSRAAKGLLPMDLLEQAATDVDEARRDTARRLWQEYEKAMTGKSAVRFSKGLRGHLGMEASKTDEELAEEEVGGEAGVYLSAPLFRRVVRDGQRAALLVEYGRYGDLAALRFVHRLYPGKYVACEDDIPGALVIQ